MKSFPAKTHLCIGFFSPLSIIFLFTFSFCQTSFAQIEGIGPPEPYSAPDFVPPPPRKSKVNLVDNGDGTLTEQNTGLMWAKADSHADLGKCLNWFQSYEYVKNLRLGGYSDWRMPTIFELYGIYDDTKENVISLDHDPNHPLALDEKFADGAAYWYWSGEYEETDLTDCCAESFYFVTGMVNVRRFHYCNHGGVRPVRDNK